MSPRTPYLAPDPYAQCLTCGTWYYTRANRSCSSKSTRHTFPSTPPPHTPAPVSAPAPAHVDPAIVAHATRPADAEEWAATVLDFPTPPGWLGHHEPDDHGPEDLPVQPAPPAPSTPRPSPPKAPSPGGGVAAGGGGRVGEARERGGEDEQRASWVLCQACGAHPREGCPAYCVLQTWER